MLERLTALIPPPDWARPYDWTDTERALGTRLPRDYKLLADTYNDTEFALPRLLHPHREANGEHDVVSMTEFIREMIHENWLFPEEAPQPLPTVPPGVVLNDPSRFIAWGDSCNGHYWLWYTADRSDPDEWRVAEVDKYLEDWYFHDGGVTAYLHDWLTRAIREPDVSRNHTLDCVFAPGESPRARYLRPEAPWSRPPIATIWFGSEPGSTVIETHSDGSVNQP